MERQKIQNSQHNTEENRGGGLALPTLRLTVKLQSVWYWQKNRK